MLQLQRASAGSGKTYTLAKKFILFLISIKEDGKKRRLRTRNEITDGLARILAITFTNKATNEMKQRIVEKLADLSKADSPEPVDSDMLKGIAYLSEFSEQLNVDPREIGKAARTALSALLNQYSDFHVSTIDSFFQTILRTFAYESNLNDSYQVEIDTDYVATAAVDATLDDVNSSASSMSSSSFWIELLMEEASSEGTQWNVFQKSANINSIYTQLRASIRRLESEEFKEIRKDLDEYFDTPDGSDPLVPAYLNLRDRVEKPVKEALATLKDLCRQLKLMMNQNGVDPSGDCQRWFDGHLRKIPLLSFDEPEKSKLMFKPLTISDKKPLFKKGVSFADSGRMTDMAIRMYDAFNQWLSLRESAEWIHWTVYSPLIPYLGLLSEACKKMRSFLESNNMIQLGETNSMLQRIIGDDDAPFIYERLGTSINHYLIDEFQDTSRMQWDNLRPLLKENDSRGQDNLIIGDAKQSIYRFRNADPSLITTSVPEEFPRHNAAGMSKADNTNWRSDRLIVEFNNFFFSALVRKLIEIRDLKGGKIDFANLYSNVAQYPSHRENRGYVEIQFLSAGNEVKTESQTAPKSEHRNDETSTLQGMALSKVGPLISSLLDRGYSRRDIAVLVDTNQLGKDVIASLVDYNSSLEQGAKKIEFISEESLLVSSSEAVGIIISVLEKMAGGSILPKEPGHENKTSWNDIRCNFNFYALRHPEMTPAMQVESFLKEDSPEDSISQMLADMQTVALPALVEAITENFVPVQMRRTQAVFIAALQDMVLEYCYRYAADVASFLNWWQSKGSERSISSPEGTDAVQIMTIHKAKGLEFKCVILPFYRPSFVPSRKSEWRWVHVAKCFDGSGLPPFIPIETKPNLEHTEHAEVYRDYLDLYMIDKINSCYVAFTRAVSELYIFTSMPGRSDSSAGYFLNEICGNADDYLKEFDGCEEREYMLPEGMAKWNDYGDILTFGEKPLLEKQDDATDGNDNASGEQDSFQIEEYGVDSSPAILHYVESDTSDTSTLMPEASDTDPRSEGNLLHAVMERVKKASDLPRAVLFLKMRGMISSAQAKEWEPMLAEAISRKDTAHWYNGKWKVLNERDILFPHDKNRRPDRVMISPDRKGAVVVDYKFGSIPDNDSHTRQVKEYMSALREAAGINRISGYVWYVRQNRLVEVEP